MEGYNAKAFFVFTIVLFATYLGCQSAQISYDGRALKIDGQRRIIISGSIHYPRSTTEMWPSLIRQAKEGGLNTIETYVFWNVHEPLRRQYDFGGNLDLVRFIKAIQDEGLYAILRIGPYVCAEWNFGGFPAWLHNMQNVTFRTTSPAFLDEMRTFTTLIVEMMKNANLFASQGGPIILAQIENEYGDVAWNFGSVARPYIQWCAQLAESLSIGVPWIMCQQPDAPDPMINTCNGFYCDQFKPKNDNIPKIWTENWTGWFKDWGDATPRRTAEDVAFAVARFYQLNGTVMNYYMYHGGTNFGRTSGGPYIITSYDYDAPLNEYGLLNQPKWGHLRQLHLLLYSLEKILTYGDHKYQEHGTYMLSSSVYTYGPERVCFFGNANSNDAMTLTFEGIQYTIPPWSVSIYRDCRTLAYNTAQVSAQTNVLDAVEDIAGLKWRWTIEPIENLAQKVHGRHHPKGLTLATELLDQKTVTNDTSDYLWYMTTVDVNKKDPVWGGDLTLYVHTTGHVIHAFVNGIHVGSQAAQNGHFEFDFSSPVSLKHGMNSISLLSATVGLQNYGAFFDNIKNGILGPVKLVTPNHEEKDLSKNTWAYKVGMGGIDQKQLYLNLPHQSWHSSQKSLPINRMFVWYKTTFGTPSGLDPVVLNLQDLGKGTAWVNGHNIGRYWPSNFAAGQQGCQACDYRGQYQPSQQCRRGCGNSTQQLYHVPRSFLRDEGNNDLVLFEEFGGDPRNVKFQTIKLVKICANVEEGNILDLSCQGRVMTRIDFASFGNPDGVCGAFTKGNCEASDSLSVVQDACIGKSRCSIDLTAKGPFRCIAGCESSKEPRRLAVEISCA
ncbi:beta-galactosidase 15-like [Coffea arabica]|uniref:Beta-galactosidase n=1 Tax=Coffea arabica TaxID=13443 RepID=A0ABM4UM44_COFAR